MKKVGTEWKFETEPAGQPSWMKTSSDDTYNCIIDEIRLRQECDDCPIISPIGVLGNNTRISHATHNGVTIVWEDYGKHVKPCEIRPINNGTEYLFKSSINGPDRIYDQIKQVDYYATKQPCDIQTEVLHLTVADQFFLSYTKTQDKSPEINEKVQTKTSTSKPSDNQLDQQLIVKKLQNSVHLQYIRDEKIERENASATKVELLECQILANKRLQELTSAQHNGWLAASILELPTCQKLTAITNIIRVQQCTEKKIELQTEITQCGPQPRYLNSTIAITGWKLVPFTP